MDADWLPDVEPSATLRSLICGRAGRLALLASVVSFVLFASLAPDALTNGDDAVYVQQIKSLDLSKRTTHLGYYLLACPLALLAPDFSDHALNLLSAFFGALTIGAIFLLTKALSGSSAAAVSSGLFLATNYVFVANSVFAEVYVSQTFFLVLALMALLEGRPIAGGLAFGLSALITPSTLLAAPGLVVLRPRLGQLIRFGAAAGLLLVLCLSWVLDDYVFGERGLLAAAGGVADLHAAVMKEGKEVVLGVSAWLPLLLLGGYELFARRRLRRFGLALWVIWLFTFLFGEKFGDVPAQLPTYAVFGVVVGVGLEGLISWLQATRAGQQRLARMALLALVAVVPFVIVAAARPFSRTLQRLPELLPPLLATLLVVVALAAALWLPGRRPLRWIVPAVLVLISGTMTISLIRGKSEEVVAYRDTVLEAGRRLQPGHLVLGTWTRGILFNHYVHAEPYHQSWLDVRRLGGLFGETDQIAAEEQWRAALAAGHEIWFLGDYPEYLAEVRREHYHVRPFGMILHARHRSRKGLARNLE